MKVSDLVKAEVTGGKLVRFVYFRAAELWYRTESGLLFPVPVRDIGDATFLAEDKALLFMRYIRKQLELAEEERARVAKEAECTKRGFHRDNGGMFEGRCKDCGFPTDPL